jgi:hypothetical protein
MVNRVTFKHVTVDEEEIVSLAALSAFSHSIGSCHRSVLRSTLWASLRGVAISEDLASELGQIAQRSYRRIRVELHGRCVDALPPTLGFWRRCDVVGVGHRAARIGRVFVAIQSERRQEVER